MANLTSTLQLKLVDDVTGPAKKIGEAMQKAESTIKAIDNTLRASGASSTFTRQLAGVAKSAEQVEQVSRAWKEYAQSVRGAEGAGNWTKSQTSQMRSWETSTIRALKNVEAAEKNFAKQQVALEGATKRRSLIPHGPGGRDGHGIFLVSAAQLLVVEYFTRRGRAFAAAPIFSPNLSRIQLRVFRRRKLRGLAKRLLRLPHACRLPRFRKFSRTTATSDRS